MLAQDMKPSRKQESLILYEMQQNWAQKREQVETALWSIHTERVSPRPRTGLYRKVTKFVDGFGK